jgi:arginyl-tRNA synthetase
MAHDVAYCFWKASRKFECSGVTGIRNSGIFRQIFKETGGKMLANYATFRQSMRIMMEGIMRTMSKVKKSVNVSLPPEILEEARKSCR